ncbi:DUF4393 domain-containing protein [Aeromonas caviae]|uniref:DUF4393 domain-containing protein n=1 Tax=Aeromonas caviae TaxID=648 RepID=UPI003014FB38
MSDKNNIRDAADAIKGIAEAVPLYQDAVQPAAKEVGMALKTVAKTIHIALAPVSALVWGYDQFKDFLSTRVAEKLKDVPPENIVTPKPNVAGPALEALRYTGHEESLRDMYANLLASSMNSSTANAVHPAFVEIIKQLTPDEARILKLFTVNRPFPLINIRRIVRDNNNKRTGSVNIVTNFSLLGLEADCERPDDTPIYLNNLCRLGLAEIPEMLNFTAPNVYDALENSEQVRSIMDVFEKIEPGSTTIVRGGLRVTDFGRVFCGLCVNIS